MKKLLVVFIIVCLAAPAMGGEGAAVPKAITDLAETPETGLDLVKACAVIAECIGRKTDAEELSAKVDELAEKLELKLEGADTDEEKIDRFINFLFKDLEVKADSRMPGRFFLLSDVLKKKKADSLGMSLLGYVLGRKAGLPVHVVASPHHVFLRYKSEDTFRNIEVYAGGEGHSNAYYRRAGNLKQSCIGEGMYLVNMKKKEILGLLLLETAVDYYGGKRAGEGLAYYETITKLLPKFPDVYIRFAFLFSCSGAKEKAVENYKTAAMLNPAFVGAWVNIGLIRTGQKKYKEAEAAFKKAVRLEPDRVSAWCYMGDMYAEKEDYDMAEWALKKALSLDPAYPPAMRSLITLLHEAERDAEAGKVFENAIKKFGDNTNLYVEYARFLVKTGDSGKAVKKLKQALYLEPADTTLYVELADVLHGLKRHDEALENYRKALVLSPEDAFVHYKLGSLFEEMMRWNEALASFENAVRIDPKIFQPLHLHVAGIYRYLERYDKAEKILKKIRKTNPENGDVLLSLASLYAMQGLNDRAEKLYIEAKGLRWESDATWKIALGEFYYALHRDREALELVESAANPEEYNYMYLWAYVLRLRLGRTDDAVEKAKEAKAKIKNDPWLVDMLSYYTDEISADSLIKKANDESDPFRRKQKLCEAYYYIGAAILARGDEKEKGTALLKKCYQLKVYNFYEHMFSRKELKRLDVIKQESF